MLELEKMIDAINLDSTRIAEECLKYNKRATKIGILFRAPFRFIMYYIYRAEYKRGITGFLRSIQYLMTSFISDLKLLRLQSKL